MKGFDNQTLRQVARVSKGGSGVRVRLSNVHGTEGLTVKNATVARTSKGSGVVPGSIRPLTVDGADEFTVPAGQEQASDPVRLKTKALDRVTVTLYFAEPTGPAEFHDSAADTSYLAAGAHSEDVDGKAFTETSESWHYLAGVATHSGDPEREQPAVVTFGDSITDGIGSTFGQHNDYPAELAERFARSGQARGVLNAGIGGNRLLSSSPCFGEQALARFERDVVNQPNAGTVIIQEGINDIGGSDSENPCFVDSPERTADEIIAAHEKLIAQAEDNGIKPVGGTLLPYQGAEYHTERGEKVRQQVNTWIRESEAYSAVIDFDRALADPDNPLRLNPAFDSGDHLHPNDAGYKAMARAIDLGVL